MSTSTDPRTVRRRGFVAVAFAFAVAMAGTTLPTPLYPLYQDLLGYSGFMTTVVFAVYAGAVIVALLLFGDLSDRIGRRPVLAAGLLFGAASAVCFLLAGSVPALLAGRVLSGLSAGLVTGTASATLVDLAAERGRARAAIVATAANMGGLGLGPVLAGAVSEWLPAPLHLTFAVHLALLAVAAAGLLRVREPVVATAPFRLRPRVPGVPAALRTTFVRIALVVFAGFAMTGLFPAVTPGLLRTLGVTDRALTGLVAGSIFAGSVAGQQLRRRLDDRTALVSGGVGLVAGAGLLAAAVNLSSVGLLVVCALVAGVGHGLAFAAGMTVLADGSPADRRAAVSSALFVVAYLGISVPVMGVGALADVVGPVTGGTVFAVLVAGLAAVATLSTLLASRRRA